MKRKKILITGASGYLGTNLTEFLKEKNTDIVCLDRSIEFRKHSEIIDIEVDLSSEESISNVKLNEKIKSCDAVVHLAWDYEDLKKNLIIMNHVKDLAQRLSAKKLIFISSIDSGSKSDEFHQIKYNVEQDVINSEIRSRVIIRSGPIFGGKGEGHFIRLLKKLVCQTNFFYTVPNVPLKVRPVSVEQVLQTIGQVIDANVSVTTIVELSGRRFYRTRELFSEICSLFVERKKIPVRSLGRRYSYFPVNRLLKGEKGGVSRLISYFQKDSTSTTVYSHNNPIANSCENGQDFSAYLSSQPSER